MTMSSKAPVAAKRWKGLKGAAVLALTGGFAIAQPAPPAPPAGPPAGIALPAPVQLGGTVASYNYGPGGYSEGVMLKAGDKVVQINFPPDVGAVLAAAAPIGSQINASATPAEGMPDHGVYDLVSLTPANGKVLSVPGPDDWKVQHIEGTVKILNYGRRGEVNGAVLDNGDFVELGPDGANLLNVAVGQKLAIDGYSRPLLSGHNEIEADFVNGTRVRLTAPPPDRGPRGGGPGPADAPPPPPRP